VIASLTGVIRAASRDVLVVDVNGVGYAVNVIPSVAASHDIGDSIDLLTTLIVREDSMTLFGFQAAQELSVFESLLTVSGVGPKSALGVLSNLSPAEVFGAVSDEDDSVFRRVSGIGPKTAKLIIVQLGGRLTSVVEDSAVERPRAVQISTLEQVTQALVGLGWPERVARDAVEGVGARTDATVAEVLKLTLSSLAHGARP
jgi:Holliday junction DNA helicase RuvA